MAASQLEPRGSTGGNKPNDPANCRVVVLISGRGSNLAALLASRVAGNPIANFVAVISNRPQAAGLTLAEQHGIPSCVVDDHGRFDDRAAYDQSLAEQIDAFSPDLLVLAGFMRILSGAFVNRYHGRMINIHPALLPAFPGMNTHQRALEAGVTEHGASVHFVSEDVDAGPVIAQASVEIHPNDSADSLAARVLEQEHRLYPLAVYWFACGRIDWHGTGLRFDGQSVTTVLRINANTDPLPWHDVPDATTGSEVS